MEYDTPPIGHRDVGAAPPRAERSYRLAFAVLLTVVLMIGACLAIYALTRPRAEADMRARIEAERARADADAREASGASAKVTGRSSGGEGWLSGLLGDGVIPWDELGEWAFDFQVGLMNGMAQEAEGITMYTPGSFEVLAAELASRDRSRMTCEAFVESFNARAERMAFGMRLAPWKPSGSDPVVAVAILGTDGKPLPGLTVDFLRAGNDLRGVASCLAGAEASQHSGDSATMAFMLMLMAFEGVDDVEQIQAMLPGVSSSWAQVRGKIYGEHEYLMVGEYGASRMTLVCTMKP